MDFMELLLVFDSHTHWEYPQGFDHKAAEVRFARFVRSLVAALGMEVPTETGGAIQDASYHSEIALPLEHGLAAWIRFSNFGDMVTVSDDNPVPETTLRLLQTLFSQHGYVYVPAAVLHAPYPGREQVPAIRTWWIRYFDYL